MLIVKGRDAKTRSDYEARRMVAYETAQLIAFSVNDPKKIPKYEPVKTKAEIPHEVQTEIVRAWLMSKVKH